ncbi:hypothetical protein [Verrucomicrobium sp. BvORR106]|uniref:hypothetical protein n=1 Tax=Verrucomicrobium sp. BvORR106 TaxID=1403819 RepID=UPI00056EAA11|nr:hypothetical protein [Verrucomicrobium sp. BvORR106]
MHYSRRQLLTALSLILFIVTAGTTALHAKRVAPPPVPPITLNGVKFTVDNQPGTMGIVTATDIRTGKKLWEKKMYTVLMNPFLEQDVQWVFIKKMEVHWPTGSPSSGNVTLRVTNEEGNIYEVDPATGQSRKLKG